MNDAMQRQLVSVLYASVLASDATYTGESGADESVRIIYKENADEFLSAGDIGVRGSAITMRVRLSEVTQPRKGDMVTYCGGRYSVDGYARLNMLEWVLYVLS